MSNFVSSGYLTFSGALDRVASVLHVQKREAQKTLRQLLYSGQVPSQIIERSGRPHNTPTHVWAGVQWGRALRSGEIGFEVAAYAPDAHGRIIVSEQHLLEALNSDDVQKTKTHQLGRRVLSKTDEIHSGMPGRPSPKHLYIEEMKRRAGCGLLCDTLAQEARDLRNWLKQKHPSLNPGTIKTIENAARGDYRSLKSKR